MKSRCVLFGVALCGVLLAAGANAQQSLDQMIDRALPALLDTYKTIHAHPELSHHEAKTAALVAGELKALGYDVTPHVGKYDNPQLIGHGVVAVLRNGKGPTVLVRTELDALPVEEKTGLPYASKAKQANDVGKEVCVMHACGHDVHMTSLLGVARMLVQLKDQWAGTLMLVAQPAEETVDGARAMVNDDLYRRFPRPDFALAQHDSATLEAGKIGYCPEFAMASATSLDVTIRGLGGHGSAPEKTKDPVVAAAQFILELQTIVSRENSPFDPAVVTVGSIHGGTRPNIIPDEVVLQLTVRTYKEDVRQKILASIERMAKGVALTAGIPEDRAPTVKVVEYTPATYNDPALTQRVIGTLEKVVGGENVVRQSPMMGSEDFGCFGLEGRQIPICMFWLGAVDPAKVAQSKQSGVALPSLHSSLFAPLPEPTIRMGVKGMTSVVLDLMKPK